MSRDRLNPYQFLQGNPIARNDPSGLKVVVDGPFPVTDNNGNQVYRYHYYNEGWFSTSFMYSKDYQRFGGNLNNGTNSNAYDQDLDCACRGRGDFASAGTREGLNSGGITGLGPTGDALMFQAGATVVFKAAHVMRHFKGSGISQKALENAIKADLAGRTCKPGFNEFQVNVGGRTVTYRPHMLPDGTINVGTAFPPK